VIWVSPTSLCVNGVYSAVNTVFIPLFNAVNGLIEP
jgi:hypothetical protein